MMQVSKKQLADVLGISERHITSLMTAGILPARSAKGFDLPQFVKAYIGYLRQPMPGDLKNERLRAMKLKSDLLELTLKQRSGELVDRGWMMNEFFAACRVARDTVQNVPSRTCGILAATSDQHEVFAILEKEIRDALESLFNSDDTGPADAIAEAKPPRAR